MGRNLASAIIRGTLTGLLLLLQLAADTKAQVNFQVLHSFGAPGDGAALWHSVVFDSQGNLYGVTGAGGLYDGGTVFELASDGSGEWNGSILYSFGAYPRDGIGPAGVTVGLDGALYGTTEIGGAYGGVDGDGTVYQLAPSPGGWTETILYNFRPRDIATSPYQGLVEDSAGNLYGSGGAFEMVRGSGGWTEKGICIQGGCGSGGLAGLGIAPGGQIFAASDFGGAYYSGNVYALIPKNGGWRQIDLYDFGSAPADGAKPALGPLALDHKGNLYGATMQGGSNICVDVGCGTIYELSPGPGGKWTETILYNFTADAALGNGPGGGVILDKAGNIYGTTMNGGFNDNGVVYELARGANGKWTYIVLHTFMNTDGTTPDSNLTFDAHGNLFGTTSFGGQYGLGVVFEISPQ
jgi:uncharacterized repeat protein (TIGR03803 family)